MIDRIDHLNIVVSNLIKAKEFFELLGFIEGIHSELDSPFLEKVTGIQGAEGRFCALRHPGSEVAIELLEFKDAAYDDKNLGLANRMGFRHLAFAVSNIEEVAQKLKDHGVEFLSPIQTWEPTGKKLVYFYGPDGILFELAQYRDT